MEPLFFFYAAESGSPRRHRDTEALSKQPAFSAIEGSSAEGSREVSGASVSPWLRGDSSSPAVLRYHPGHQPRRAMSFANVILLDHPVIQTKLAEMRDYTTEHRKFRTLLNEISALMVYEVTRDWPTMPRMV